MNKSTNKRLAKNTLFLYFRLFLTMAITFYTTRVVLDKLGVDDYGIYNTLGSVAVMFVYVNNAMVTAVQRFLNFYLGKNEIDNVKLIFSQSLLIHFIIGLFSVILIELVGLWFLYNKMSLPADRMGAAFWMIHIVSLVTFSRIIRTPYNACIIAYEKMDYYAYVSIMDVVLKLLVVYLLSIVNFDKLILYGCLNLMVSFFVTFIYKSYCNKHFPISKFKYQWNKNIFNELFQFSFYSLLGNLANMSTKALVNLVLNSFCGVVVNASAGVSSQVSRGVYSLIANFQVAFNPILVKTYAKNNFIELKNLIYKVSKLSYYLMFCICLPVLIYTEDIFDLWLKEIPFYTIEFCRLTILTLLIDTLAEPLWKTVQASGRIKTYQIVVSLIIFSNLPLCYIIMRLGGSPVLVFVIKLIVNFCAYLYRFYYANSLVHFTLLNYIRNIISPVLVVSSISILLSICIFKLNLNFIVSSILIVFMSVIVVYLIGTTQSEKQFITEIVRKRFKRIK